MGFPPNFVKGVADPGKVLAAPSGPKQGTRGSGVLQVPCAEFLRPYGVLWGVAGRYRIP